MAPSNQHTTQVVIIGAGPTGLSLAAQLIRYDIGFIILERNARTTDLSKAIVVQARTLEIFQELGIAEEAIRRGTTTTGLSLYYKGRPQASVDLQGLGEGVSEFTFALSLEQRKTERLLYEYLERHGRQVQWSAELTAVAQNDEGVMVSYHDAQGTVQTIAAAYLVGCDGAGSAVRHGLGLPFEGSTEPRLFYVADVVVESPVIRENILYMYPLRQGFALFFPMEGREHYRIVGVLPGAADADRDYRFEDIAPGLQEQLMTPVTFRQVNWFSTYRVHSRRAGAFRKGRCFIAGDAAHIHTPAGGQGMNTGIQDAYNLAWKLAYRLRGEAGDAVLQTYDAERTANADRLLRTTDHMFDIMSGTNGFWNFLRLHVFPRFLRFVTKSPGIRRRIFPVLSQTSIAYPHSYLTLESAVGKVRAGDRMHYFTTSDGKSIFSYLTEPAFKLLYFGTGGTGQVLPSGLKMSYLSFPEIPRALFGDATDFYILLRPDNHVSYIGKDLAQCRKLAERITQNME